MRLYKSMLQQAQYRQNKKREADEIRRIAEEALKEETRRKEMIEHKKRCEKYLAGIFTTEEMQFLKLVDSLPFRPYPVLTYVVDSYFQIQIEYTSSATRLKCKIADGLLGRRTPTRTFSEAARQIKLIVFMRDVLGEEVANITGFNRTELESILLNNKNKLGKAVGVKLKSQNKQ